MTYSFGMLNVSIRRYLTGVPAQEESENQMISELPVPPVEALTRGAYATT